MHNTTQKIMIEFESNADKLFIHLYKQFDTDTLRLDRDEDENVFQQTASQYTFTLKQQLTQIALQLIEEYKKSIGDISHIQQMLTQKIAAYANEFYQKTKQL